MKIPLIFSLIHHSLLINRFKKVMITLNFLRMTRSTTIISVNKIRSTSVLQSMLILDTMTSLDVIFSGLDSRVLWLLISVLNQRTKTHHATKRISLIQYQLRMTIMEKAIKLHMMGLLILKIKVTSFLWLVPIGRMPKRILINLN